MNSDQIDKALEEWAASDDVFYAHGKSFRAGWEAALRNQSQGKISSCPHGVPHNYACEQCDWKQGEPVAWEVTQDGKSELLFHAAFVRGSFDRASMRPLTYADAAPPADGVDLQGRCTELDTANLGLAEEVRILRHHIDELVEALDGTNDLDEMDGEEYRIASDKLARAVEAARPHTEQALLEKAMLAAAPKGGG